MTPVTQTILNATRGNCFGACLASLLDVACEDVPSIHDFGKEWFYPLNAWLLERYKVVLLMIEATTYANKVWFPDGVPFIASCDGPGGFRHAVVMEYRGMETITIHDPFPGRVAGLSGPVFMYFLVKP